MGKWDSANDIDFNKLPNEFVIKPNNGSYDAVIVKDKSSVDVENVRNWMQSALSVRFGWDSGEIHYLKMQPCIIVEKLIENRQCSWFNRL